MTVFKGKEDWTDVLYDEEDEDTASNRFLTFQVGRETYAIEIQHVMEIIGILNITEVPDMPEFMMGVINLRGKIIPVVDVRRRFNLEPRAYDDRTCIVIVSLFDVMVGLIVDTVCEVLYMPEEQITLPPTINNTRQSQFIMGLGRTEEDVKILLDVNKLLFLDHQESLVPSQLTASMQGGKGEN